ncbi:MAG: hypothetical protein AMXMBFR83_22190 [Phycisphaerae bacterium]
MRPLRIFYAAARTPDSAFESDLWRQNLYQPLVDLGHDVVEFDYDLRPTFQHLDVESPEDRAFIERNRPRLERELLLQVTEAHLEKPVDVFFSYFYSACARPATIRAIRDMGILTVNWYCNASYQLHLVAELAPAYDYCLVPEYDRLEDYRRLGANPLYCQEAANPNFYRPFDEPYRYDASFVGQAYGNRPFLIESLHQAGLDVRVWGNGWGRVAERRRQREGRDAPDPRYGGILSDEEVVRTFSRSRINLGFAVCGSTHKTDAPIRQIRLRDFEVPMSGGFYLTEYQQELERFFEIGREVACFHDLEDLIGKVRYYLAHEDEREAIRRAGLERCRREHSWQRRFEQAFAAMRLEERCAVA